MVLNQFTSELRSKIFEELKLGFVPSEGTYSEQVLRDARSKGQPQLGSTRYEPNAIVIEFIYPSPGTTATVVSVRVSSPERIVFMPVPAWVVESIWQGEIDGSYHFESEAENLLAQFAASLTPEANLAQFGDKAPTRRG